jgi:endo-1,4-beta-xylanase
MTRHGLKRLASAVVWLASIACGETGDAPEGTALDGVNAANAGSGGMPSAAGAGAGGAAIGAGGMVAAGASGNSAGQGGAGCGAGGSAAVQAGAGGAAGTGGAGGAGLAGSAAGNAGNAGTAGAGGTAGSAAGAGAGAGTGGTGGSAGAPPASEKFVGNITTSNMVRSDFVAYWDQITPENEGKWGSVEATRDQMQWAGLDRVHDYAVARGIPFKQHTLVWGSQQPGWLAGLSQAQQRAEVEQWIRLFCERYPDVALIDVVNEPPPHTTPVYMAALGGAGSSGYDWIVQAFRWARQYCPNAILILNDYNNIEYGDQAAHFIAIANAVKAAGAPIDAVGAQAHDAFKLPTATVKGFIDTLASSTGLPVYITEYDIDLADDAQQRQVMESQLTMFWNHPQVKGITLWGYVSGATWRPNTGLMSASGTERPALSWLKGFLER